MEKIKWCFNLKKGLKIVEPNKNLSESYFKFSEDTLSKVKRLINEEDYLWASVRIYYCAYYCVYGFLQRIGVKSENHDCSIELIKVLLEENEVKDIDSFKDSRIESQYYLKSGKKEVLIKNYDLVKKFYLKFKEKVSLLNEKEVQGYRNKIKEILNEK